jgi:tetratricopeptide (TPR) repeat protein
MLNTVMPFFRLRPTRGWLLLMTALAGGLAFVPLFNLLAYEFCLALSLSGSFAAAHLGAVQVDHARRRNEGPSCPVHQPPRALFSFLLHHGGLSLLLLLPPLMVISLNALRVKNCDYFEGLAFFILMPVMSVVLSSVLGSLWGLVFQRSLWARCAAILTVMISLGWGLYRFYAAPPIFGYDPFVGYFPGALYDQNVAIQPAFYFARLYHFCFLLALGLGAAHFFDPATLRLRLGAWHPRWGVTLFTIISFVAAIALFLLRAPLGFVIDEAYIAAQLGARRMTPHFIIHYPSELRFDDIELVVQDHEFRYAQLAALFGEAPSSPIRTFIFRDEAEKQKLMGASGTFIAKPWLNEVYLQRLGFPHPVLKHELAHVFAADHGDAVLKISLRWEGLPFPHPVVNMGLIEGLAVAADWAPSWEMTGHQLAAALVRLGLAPSATSLFGYGFFSSAASRGYIFSGSFCRFLLERYGMKRLLAVYRSGGKGFEQVYGQPLPGLLREWLEALKKVPLPPAQLQLARERFRQPSIFRRVCSHEIANRLQEAENLAARGFWDKASSLYAMVCRYDESEPLHAIHWMHSEMARGQYPQALHIARRLLKHPAALSNPLERQLWQDIGDIYWLSGQLKKVSDAYQRAGVAAADASQRRALYLRRWSLAQPAPQRENILRYLVGQPGVPRDRGLDVYLAYALAQQEPESGLGLFLVGKQLAAANHCREAAPLFTRAIHLGFPHEDFVVETYRQLGICQYKNGNHKEAQQILLQLLWRKRGSVALSEGDTLEIQEWLERISWRRDTPSIKQP